LGIRSTSARNIGGISVMFAVMLVIISVGVVVGHAVHRARAGAGALGLRGWLSSLLPR